MIRGFQWDLARQVERLDWLLAQLPRYAGWGYNELYVHLEDAIEYPSLPGVARKDAYSHRQFGRLVDAATRVGIKVVPIVNLLGHTQYLIKVPELRDLNELRRPDGAPLEKGQICPSHPRTFEVAERLLRDVGPFCTAGKVHVGLDESFHLGKHPLARAEIEEIGLPAHFSRYVGRLREMTRSHGLGMGIWADMLYFLPQAIPQLPRDIAAYEWYYYGFKRRPRVEFFNFAESDIGEQLVRHGVEYWGCPMNGAFRFEPLPHFSDRLDNILSWWRRCGQLNAGGFLVTSWEPYRLAMELTTVVDAAAASLWLDGIAEPRRMLERGFERVFGRRGAKAAARLALACDKHPFSGYPRWEINSRWDVISRREPVAPFKTEERHFRKLRTKAAAPGVPQPLRSSIDLRWYLAARDVWVRQAARDARSASSAGGLREALKLGLKAAREMWARTRASKVRGANEDILRSDAVRLEQWAAGEPVFSPEWQLVYRVQNFAPAVQLVGVEQRQLDGTWKTLQACHTIEFQSAAAKPRGGFTREHAAPVDWGGDPARMPDVRLFVRGVGEVRISALQLTNGRIALNATKPKLRIGKKAPRGGFPPIAGPDEQDCVVLKFRARQRARRQTRD